MPSGENNEDQTRAFEPHEMTQLVDTTALDQTSAWQLDAEPVQHRAHLMAAHERQMISGRQPLIGYDEAKTFGLHGAIMAEVAVGRVDGVAPMQRLYLVDMLPFFYDTYAAQGLIMVGRTPVQEPTLDTMWRVRRTQLAEKTHQKWVTKLVERSRWWLIDEQVCRLAQALTAGDMDTVSKLPRRSNLQYGLAPSEVFEIGRAHKIDGRQLWHNNVSRHHCSVVVSADASEVWLKNHEPLFQTLLDVGPELAA